MQSACLTQQVSIHLKCENTSPIGYTMEIIVQLISRHCESSSTHTNTQKTSGCFMLASKSSSGTTSNSRTENEERWGCNSSLQSDALAISIRSGHETIAYITN